MAGELIVRARRHVLDVDVAFDLASAPVTVLFGPSGAGKTTLLRLVAGLERPDPGGLVALDGDVWAGPRWVPARRRRVGLCFQDAALFPHMSVTDNVAYGLHRIGRGDRARRVAEVLDVVGAADLVGARIPELSGGERQRISLARALAPRPDLLLLDEPLSALDTPTRLRLQRTLRHVVDALGTPALLVSHDRSEAMALADRMAVLVDGRLRQVDTVERVFGAPADADVAAVVGTETTVTGRVVGTVEGVTTVDVHGVRLAAATDQAVSPGAPVIACIRGENVTLSAEPQSGSSARNHLPSLVTAVTDHGPVLRVDLDAGFPLVAYVTRPARDELGLAPGARVVAVVKAPAIHLVPRG